MLDNNLQEIENLASKLFNRKYKLEVSNDSYKTTLRVSCTAPGLYNPSIEVSHSHPSKAFLMLLVALKVAVYGELVL